MNINSIISKHLKEAHKIASQHVEVLARKVLTDNPEHVYKFMMAMGSYFFIDKNDNIIHDSMGNNLNRLRRMKGYTKLEKFILKWDKELAITGEPMTFTATGKKITDW